jgi:hypothetical protein
MMLYRLASTYSVTITRSSSASRENVGSRKVKAWPCSSKPSRVAARSKDSDGDNAANRSRTELM